VQLLQQLVDPEQAPVGQHPPENEKPQNKTVLGLLRERLLTEPHLVRAKEELAPLGGNGSAPPPSSTHGEIWTLAAMPPISSYTTVRRLLKLL